MTQKHTPGPWRVNKNSATTVNGSKGYAVAACGLHSDNSRDSLELHNELLANAALIARAPDLLAENAKLAERVRVLTEALQQLLLCPQPGRMQSATERTKANQRHIAVCHKARAALSRAKEEAQC